MSSWLAEKKMRSIFSPVAGSHAWNELAVDAESRKPIRDFPRISIGRCPLFRRLPQPEFGAGFLWTSAESVVDQLFRSLQFFASQPEFWRPDIGVPNAKFFLHEFDELNKLRDCIETKQGQEPAIQLESFRGFSLHAVVEEVHGFARQCIGKAGDPTDSSHSNAFENGIVNAN